jgi:hypothetical protein
LPSSGFYQDPDKILEPTKKVAAISSISHRQLNGHTIFIFLSERNNKSRQTQYEAQTNKNRIKHSTKRVEAKHIIDRAQNGRDHAEHGGKPHITPA